MKILNYNYVSDILKNNLATFFQKNHKEYYDNFYSPDNTGFNLSMTQVSGNIVVCYVRYMMFESRDKKFIPGNNNSRTYSRSALFMWNNWSRQYVQKVDKGIVFLATLDKDKFEVVSELILFNHNAIDARFIKINDQVYLCGTDLHVTYKIDIDIHSYQLKMELTKLFMTHDVIGKNFAFVQYHDQHVKLNKSCEYLNWFDYKERSVTNFFINADQILKDKFLKLNGDVPNYDSDYPAFSFGSPFVDLDKFKIGMGHIKITRLKEYQNENVEKFRQMVNTQFPLKFGAQYVEHDGAMVLGDYWGYIYMAYFYLLVKRGNGYTLYFSDAFLPLNYNKEHMDKYKFSLVFPTGIVVQDNLIHVSCGEGDYYNTILTFDKQDVLKACRHDVSMLNLKNFDYKLLIYEDNNTTEKKQLLDAPDINYSEVFDLVKLNGIRGSLSLTEKVFAHIISYLSDGELYIITETINKSLPKLVDDTKSILTKHSVSDSTYQTNFLRDLKTGDSNVIVKESIKMLCHNRKLKDPLKRSLTELLLKILSFKKCDAIQLLELLHVDNKIQAGLVNMHNKKFGFT